MGENYIVQNEGGPCFIIGVKQDGSGGVPGGCELNDPANKKPDA